MEILKISFLVVAYTSGIATIFLQILCYLKKIEPKETLIFSISFLMLVLWATISELLPPFSVEQSINRLVYAILITILGFTTPLNIHAERQVNYQKSRDRAIGFSASTLLVAIVVSYTFGFFQTMYVISIVFLNTSIFYSMITIITTRPKYIIKHRDKIEKKTAVFIIGAMFTIILAGILAYGNEFFNEVLLSGPMALASICIVLCVFKITDDIQRLALISNAKRFSFHHLSEYHITPREKEVIQLLIKGYSYRAIADKLFISIPTVKTHATNIYQKLNISSKIELVNLLSN